MILQSIRLKNFDTIFLFASILEKATDLNRFKENML